MNTLDHPNIELGSLSSNAQLARQRLTQNPTPNTQHKNPQSQEEEENLLQNSQTSSEQPQEALPTRLEPQQRSIDSKTIRKERAVSLARRMYAYFFLLGVILIGGSQWYFWVSRTPIKQIYGSISESLELISANLQADPIMDLRLLEPGLTCPENFKALKLGVWPGTVAGCLCENGEVYGTSCDKVNTEKCEKDIPSTPPIDMYEWDGSMWCIKRAVLGTDYVKKTECPPIHKECYPGGCFIKECPITKIDINSNGVLSLTKTQGELPIINAQITFGDIPCFTQDLFSQAIKNSSYELSAIKEHECDKYGLNTQFSAKLDSQTAYDSLIQNSFPASVMNLPSFENNTKSTISLLSSMTRMKTAKNDHCLNLSFAPINDFVDFIDGWYSVLLVYTILLFLLFDLRSLSVGGLNDITNDEQGLEHADVFYSKTSFFSSAAALIKINLCLSLIMTFVLVWFHENTNQKFIIMKEYFEGFNSLRCFEGGQGNLVINDSLEIIRKMAGCFWIYWVMLVASVLSNIKYVYCFIVRRYCLEQIKSTLYKTGFERN